MWRHVRAVLLLPTMLLVVVPTLITVLTGAVHVGWGLEGGLRFLPPILGVLLIGLGFLLMARTISFFVRLGEGTLAPWDPTKKLVVEGIYRHLRNPMITGAMLVLLGETALVGSLYLLAWFGFFVLINLIGIPLVEEPGLHERFGAEYDEYKRNVPRWIPRRKPWNPA